MDTKGKQLQQSDDRLDMKKVLPVFVIILIDLLGLTIIIPLMSLYAVSFGADAGTIGLLGAAYPAFQFIGAPLLGRLSDRFGRKPILIISQIGTLIGFLVLGLAHSLWALFLARIIDGLSGANIATAQAVITDSTNEKTRTQGLGLVGAAFGLGFVVGPVIGFLSLSVSNNNFHVPAFVAAGFSLLSILFTSILLKETLAPDKVAHPERKREFNLRNFFTAMGTPFIGFLLVLMFVQQLVFGGFQQLLSLFALSRLGLTASSISILFVYAGVVIVAVQGYFIGKWSRKFGERRLVHIGLAAMTGGMLLIALTPHQPLPSYDQAAVAQQFSNERSLPGETPPTSSLQISLPSDANKGYLGLGWLMAAIIPMAIGGGVLQPSINSLLTSKANPSEVGGMLGISAALLSGANAFAPLAGGAIFQSLGPSAVFFIGAGVVAIAFLASLIKFKTVVKASPVE
jgi:MFS transporter, DHA1 family, tetracycline resistance protein